MKFNYCDGQRPNHLFDSHLMSSLGCTFSDNSYAPISKSSRKEYFNEKEKNNIQPTLLESLCQVFRTNKSSLNSPFHKLNQNEFGKVRNTVTFYKSRIPDTKFVEWCIESGEHSTSTTCQPEATTQKLVCHFLSKKHKVMGKLVINNAERKLVMPRIVIDGYSNFQLLKNMRRLTDATVKDMYTVPTNHTKLSDIDITTSRLQIFGVVTAVNKLPTKTTSSWHSLICISDPSLIPVTDGDQNDKMAPGEFKMSLFMNMLEDHPEFHRGDVVRFTNVKIESYKNRCDGRVFNKSDITLYCHPDIKAPVIRESFQERAAVVRVLSLWWTLNHRFFDYVTPNPIYHLPTRYPGIRAFRELSDQLVCDLYCQVVSMSEDSSDLNFLCVWDGTIFTFEKRQQSTTHEASSVTEQISKESQGSKLTFGFLGLAIFETECWNSIRKQRISVNDYVLMCEVKVVFLTEETLTNLRNVYAYRHPCVLLRPAAGGIKKIPLDHHEAYKIRSRLHRLPDELEKMDHWQFPPPAEEKVPEDPLLVRLNESTVQMNLLKRLKRS
ncbi:uncharacterized protein LOC130697467 [Daphnia carinata]|uniref:uncharacterized protein LOC130697467 n=1 Tax=Daphnia carinata TaxID=120202 RepID=UPI002580C25F|nr:uncharacterized protein LOC130697467 [Daphnia carinata]